jgi:cell division GTPase FtsZ
MIYLIPLAVFFLVVLVFIIIYKRKKPIYIGLGTSGLNVAKAWKEKGGEAFTLMDNKYNIESIQQYLTIEEIIQSCSLKRKYVVVSGLGGKTSKKMLVDLIQVLDEKNIQFKILSYLPFKLEGTLRNQQASQIHEKLIVRENYHFVNINKEVKKYPNIDLPELFKKMDQIGLEIMA